MSARYFCYNCQVVVPAIQPSARRGLTCLYCLREAVEKIGEEENCWDEDAPAAMNDPQLDSALNLLEQLTVQPSSALPYGGEEDNVDDYYYDHETYDSDYDGLRQLDSFPSSPLPVDAIDDSFSDTPSFLAGYLGIDDPDNSDDWAPINDSITSYLINDGFDEDFYSVYSDDNYDDLLVNTESSFLTEPHEQFDDFMLQLMETRQRLSTRGDDTLEEQALPLDWLYDSQPPR
ncbi:hypothetical protein [Absidia glauca]|uniref:Uncharacterized protein n=1 Tax=Absidia glauca TaxID=4829 RepID=A0A163K4Z7_ABSGL|nr:hypothetical protein [Absidia glauca]